MSELQDLVDGLAAALGSPVGVDDRRFHSMAYSAHADEIDHVRLASILQREAPAGVIRWLEELDVSQIRRSLRVPANPRLGMSARVCVPLRFDDRLLGYLWLIDGPPPLSDASLQIALDAAPEIAVAMYRIDESEQSDREVVRRHLRAVLGFDDGDPEQAAGELISRGRLAPVAAYAVLAVAPRHRSEPPPDLIRARVTAAVEHQRRLAGAGHLLVLVAPHYVYGLFADDGMRDVARHAEEIRARVDEGLGDFAGWHATVGISARHEQRGLLPEARLEAEIAGDVADRVTALGPVGAWPDLGSYRTIARAIDGRDPAGLLPLSLRRLLDSDERDTLVPTLLAFLDLGGDAAGAAKRLYLHRSSLYSRLHRIERICDVRLSSGDVRLELHLGLRLWQLAGEP
ncbi:MAG: helix-turn-helix domain-containing protein [Solirubrobacterales bacterium]|nr:helix-turn-helix domain-containing protein [Solirubrobacterales bacterium]